MKIQTLLIPLVLLVSGAANAATTFDFSAGDPGAGRYNYNPTVPNAVFYGNSGLENNSGAWGFTTPPGGGLVAFVQSNPGQGSSAGTGVPGDVTLTFGSLTSGLNYLVSFEVESRPGYGVGLPFTVNGVGYGTPSQSGWTAESYAFTATGATENVSFAVANIGSDASIGVNSVSVSAVPEPSTWAMLLIGFAGLGFAAARRATPKAA